LSVVIWDTTSVGFHSSPNLFLTFFYFRLAIVAFVCLAVLYTRPCVASSFSFLQCAINNPQVTPYFGY